MMAASRDLRVHRCVTARMGPQRLHSLATRPTYRRSQRLAGFHWLLRRCSHDRDTLVCKPRKDLELAPERFDVASQRCELTVLEIRARFESGDIRLVHLRLLRYIDLRLARCFTQRS